MRRRRSRQAIRITHERELQPVPDEAGNVAPDEHRHLPSAATVSYAKASVSGVVRSPAITSTVGMSNGGLDSASPLSALARRSRLPRP